MKAILIAPDLAEQGQMVQELEIDGGLQSIYDVLDCSLIDTIRLDERGNVMYVDDEGYMVKDKFFLFGNYPMPIAGRGLILGTAPDGESASTTLSVVLIQDIVRPLTAKQAYERAKREDERRIQDIKDRNQESFHIYIRVSEIMERAWYAEQLGLQE